MTQEALKLALDALETELSIDWTNNDEFNASAEKMYEAIAAIKEALTQPTPAEYAMGYAEGFNDGCKPKPEQWGASVVTHPEYVAEQKRKTEELRSMLTQPEQEPVAYINVEERKLEWAKPISWNTPTTVKLERIPLYTHSQRTWVGLTDEQKYQLCNSNYNRDSELVEMVEAKLKQKNGYAEEKNT